jgi:Fe2+ or Zn2+ uptake regulation protein
MASPRSASDDPRSGNRPTQIDWRAVGLRRTPQREIVLGLVQSTRDHPTADWIHHEARRILPDISLATVYRTLRILKEKGLIHEFSGGASPSRYDGVRGDHEHVRCVRCGMVEDVAIPEVGDVRERVAERTGFRMSSFPLLFHGLCGRCFRELEERGERSPQGVAPGGQRI